LLPNRIKLGMGITLVVYKRKTKYRVENILSDLHLRSSSQISIPIILNFQNQADKSTIFFCIIYYEISIFKHLVLGQGLICFKSASNTIF
jgi:hypothetical protein